MAAAAHARTARPRQPPEDARCADPVGFRSGLGGLLASCPAPSRWGSGRISLESQPFSETRPAEPLATGSQQTVSLSRRALSPRAGAEGRQSGVSRPFRKALKWKKERKIFSYLHVHFPPKASRHC